MRIFFIFLTLIYSKSLFSKEINLQFEIDWKSVHLADLEWDISLNKDNYSIDFVIQSYGMTDKIFKYKSVTNIEGLIENNQLHPLTYKSKTKSTKQDVYANLNFSPEGKVLEFDISKEINDEQLIMQNQFINQYQFFTDPISQLVQYFLYQTDSDRMIIDGLNIYSLKFKRLNDEIFEKNNPTTYTIIFPFFQGLHKLNKKNNLQEIKMNYIELDNYLFPTNFEFDESQAAFVVSYPHYEGSCQDLTALVERAKEKGLVTICYVDPSMLGVLTTPGQMGFDIIVAEGQSLGSPLSFGGPTVGWFATKKEFARLVPGRLIGESRDKDGNKSYVMTLRAREQDIRREKASSNICTNQTLNAIGSAIHLSWLGPEGIFEMGYHAIQKANYMRKQLIKNGYVIPNDDSSLREFLLDNSKNV